MVRQGRMRSLPFSTTNRPNQAYFDCDAATIFRIIDRSKFENRLREQFKSGTVNANDDSPWYALRNMVYALGSRFILTRGPQRRPFVEVQECGLKYFKNALSVIVDLMYTETSITAVQSLLVMVSV